MYLKSSTGLCRCSKRLIIRSFVTNTWNLNKKEHWAKELSKRTSVTRALDHFDEFYAAVYQNKWPSLRLGLLSAPKYVAIPNVFTGDVGPITEALETMGSYNIANIWKKYSEQVEREQENIRLKQDLRTVDYQEEAVDSIARKKEAAEIDTLYHNAPRQKMIIEPIVDASTASARVLNDIKEASMEFMTDTKIKGGEDFLLESEYFSFYSRELQREEGDTGVMKDFEYTKVSDFTRLKFPPLLQPYAFEPGNPNHFPGAGKNKINGLRDFICVNGGSLAPIIALDLKPGVTFLDLCSGPGTKSLMTLLSNCVGSAVLNDVDHGRLDRVKRLMEEFTGSRQPSEVSYTRFNASNYPTEPKFSRVLADVPCLSDRVSCTIPDNNIFKPSRTRERIGLVQVQKKILQNAFETLSQEPGSTIVYSTCTLSPIENDGVVGAALKEITYDGLKVDLLGLWTALKPLELAGYFYLSRTKFGVMIEPNISSNFGPMYVSRLVYKPFNADDVRDKLSQLE